eukprot:Rhum_TRINITY_DN14476_c1_g1::Rhum_TRINITY_DN14476_c1_g1_i1::g.90266::m.90266
MYTKAALTVLLWASAPAAALHAPCADLTVNNGQPWMNAFYYTCAQVAENKFCGSTSPSFGMTAAQVCCACGGGTLPVGDTLLETESSDSGSDHSGSGSGHSHSGSGSDHSGSGHSGSGSDHSA